MEIFLQLAGVAYFVFAMVNLRLAVVLLPVFFPAYLLKFDLFGVPFPFVEVCIYGCFLAWMVQIMHQLFTKKITVRTLIEPFRRFWWFAVLGIVVAAVFSVIVAPQSVVMMDGNTIFYGRKIAMGILKSWIFAPVLMMVLFTSIFKKAEDFEMAVNAYTIGAVLLAGWGVYQVLTGQYLTPDGRASGPFNSANYLALFITPALLYVSVRLKDFFTVSAESWWMKVLHFFRHPANTRMKFFLGLVWVAAFLVLLFGLLFTKSYAAFLAYFAACLFWFFSQIKSFKKFPWALVGVGALVVVLLVVGLITLDPAKWQMFFQLGTRTSSGVRVEIYTIAIQLLFRHPLTGIGLGMFPAAYQLEGPQILGHAPYEWNMLHPHNVFLAFWLNLGLLGFLSFLALLGAMFRKAWKFAVTFAQQHQLTLEWFQGLGLLMMLIILGHGLVDTSFFKNDLALLFWLCSSLILLPVSWRKS